MTEEKEEQVPAFCPNCNSPATKIGKVIVCEKCDARFRFTTEGYKVKDTGKIDELDGRTKKLEDKVFGSTPEPEPEPAIEEAEDDL